MICLYTIPPYIAVLKKVRYGGESYAYARCPRPEARCPIPYEHLMLLRKAIYTYK